MMIKTVKYFKHNKDFVLEKYGNWIDLSVSKNYSMEYLDFEILDLGVSMQLPDWYKAEIKPRSSTFKKFGIIQTNSIGEIDTEYGGMKDRWGFPALCLSKSTFIEKNSRICQFTVKLREDAPWYMKILDLFTTIKFKEVDILTKTSRGGFGSSGTTTTDKETIAPIKKTLGYEPHII